MPSPEQVVDCIARGDTDAASRTLEQISRDENHGLPADFLQLTRRALVTQDWTCLTVPFLEHGFLGSDRTFLLVAPYTVRRGGRDCTGLSALYGAVLPHRGIQHAEAIATELFGPLRQPISRVLPIRVLGAAGQFGRGELSEAFIVPDGWAFSRGEGPALNNMAEHRRRYSQPLRECIRRIFTPDTASLLLQPLAEETQALQIQHTEFQLHDVGHATGIGLQRKLSENLLPSPWYRAVEEWRADGTAFTVAAELFDGRELADLIAANLCVRFGVDSHRAGGLENDADCNASLLTFNALLQSGLFELTADHQLKLSLGSQRGLVQAVAQFRAQAGALTWHELRLPSGDAIPRLYGQLCGVDTSTRALFQSIVIDRCKGVYTVLQ